MPTHSFLKLIFLILLSGSNLSVNAMTLLLPDKASGLDLSDNISYLNSEQTDPKSIIKNKDKFKSFHQREFKLTPGKVWYLLEINQPQPSNQQWFIQAQFPNVPLLKAYIKDSNNNWQLLFDDSKPFSERTIDHPLIVMPLNLSTLAHHSILFEYVGIANTPLSLKLYDKVSIEKDKTNHLLINCTLIAFTLLISIFSLLQWLITLNNKSAALTLLAFLISLFISESSGFNFQYLWPEHPQINKFSPTIIITLVFAAYLLFTARLFDLKKFFPKLNIFYNVVIISIIILSGLNYFVYTLHISFSIAIILTPLPIITGVLALRARLWAAQFFLLGAIANIILNNLLSALYAMGLFFSGTIPIVTLSKMGFIMELIAFAGALIYLTALIQQKLKKAEQQEIENARQLLIAERKNNALQLQQQQEANKQQLIQQRANMMAELIEKKNQLLTDVSHELATPITILKLQLEALQDDLEDDVQLTYLAMTQKLSEMERLIGDIYQLAQVDIGEFELHTEQIAFHDVIEPWSKSYHQLVTQKQLHWQFNNKLHCQCTVNIDSGRINQILTNLINNSVKYTTAPGTVVMSCYQQKNKVIIQIEDSAPGVLDHELALIFERLYRCESSRNRTTGGTGLGLSICKSLVQVHHGSIKASHSSLGGIKITIELPEQGPNKGVRLLDQ